MCIRWVCGIVLVCQKFIRIINATQFICCIDSGVYIKTRRLNAVDSIRFKQSTEKVKGFFFWNPCTVNCGEL